MAAIKTVVSKSTMRKMSSAQNQKANTYTEMVIYKTRAGKNRKGKAKYTSVTKHEVRRKK